MDIPDVGAQLRAEVEPEQPSDEQYQKHAQLKQHIQQAMFSTLQCSQRRSKGIEEKMPWYGKSTLHSAWIK